MAKPVRGSVTTGLAVPDQPGFDSSGQRRMPSISNKMRDFCRAADIVVAETAPNRMLAVIIAGTQ
jgi:hypothetical protein